MTTDIAPLTTEPAAEPDAGLGALATSRGNLPLEAVDVRPPSPALAASVELTQGFRNPYDVPLEATYVFPLPDRAAVTALPDGGRRPRRRGGAAGARAGPGGRTTRRSRPGSAPRSPRRSGRTSSPCGSATSLPGERVTVELHAGPAAAVRRRRGDVPLPAGGRAALHPRHARCGGAQVGDGRGRRHRRRPRRLADHPAGAAARLPEPGRGSR